VLVFLFSQRYTTQFTAESRVVFKMHDLLQKKQDTAVFAGSAFQKVSVALSCVTEKIRKCITVSVYCFPASVLLFFNNAAFLRQNIDDAWKRFRFNPS